MNIKEFITNKINSNLYHQDQNQLSTKEIISRRYGKSFKNFNKLRIFGTNEKEFFQKAVIPEKTESVSFLKPLF